MVPTTPKWLKYHKPYCILHYIHLYSQISIDISAELFLTIVYSVYSVFKFLYSVYLVLVNIVMRWIEWFNELPRTRRGRVGPTYWFQSVDIAAMPEWLLSELQLTDVAEVSIETVAGSIPYHVDKAARVYHTVWNLSPVLATIQQKGYPDLVLNQWDGCVIQSGNPHRAEILHNDTAEFLTIDWGYQLELTEIQYQRLAAAAK